MLFLYPASKSFGSTMYLFSLTACMPASWQMALMSAPEIRSGLATSVLLDVVLVS